jgi:hypothetical protein
VAVCYLQSCFNSFGQRAEIADALHFVIGQFDAEMVFQPRQQAERLQAVNAERFEKIVVGRQRRAVNVEMRRSQIENFVNDLFDCFHLKVLLLKSISPAHQHGTRREARADGGKQHQIAFFEFAFFDGVADGQRNRRGCGVAVFVNVLNDFFGRKSGLFGGR